ncbi:MAG: SDR family NAD(P)-dependent oxidoreductase [Rhodospirillaceae bacterium]|nr:SDR family NAD(P)-dependent oxidoreductase [Rhodospirillaceae bacterium]
MNEKIPQGPLSGKRALVTGASGGVGLAIARSLAGTGAALSLSAIGSAALEQTAEEIRREFGVEVETHIANLAHAVDADALALSCAEVNILVSATGNIPHGQIETINDDAWRKSWNAAVYAPINLIREMWRNMHEAPGGLIIIVIDSPNSPLAQDINASMAGGALMALVEAMGISESESNPVRVLGLVSGRKGDGAGVAAAISRIACEPEKFKSGTLLSPDAINAG